MERNTTNFYRWLIESLTLMDNFVDDKMGRSKRFVCRSEPLLSEKKLDYLKK